MAFIAVAARNVSWLVAERRDVCWCSGYKLGGPRQALHRPLYTVVTIRMGVDAIVVSRGARVKQLSHTYFILFIFFGGGSGEDITVRTRRLRDKQKERKKEGKKESIK